MSRGQSRLSVLWSAQPDWLYRLPSLSIAQILSKTSNINISNTWEWRENFLFYVLLEFQNLYSKGTNYNILTFPFAWNIVLFYKRKTSYLLSSFLTFEKQIFHSARYLARGRRGEVVLTYIHLSYLWGCSSSSQSSSSQVMTFKHLKINQGGRI